MAKITQCLGIDIGSHTIRIAEVSLGANWIDVKNLVEATVDLDPDMTQTERHNAMAAQINDIIKSNRLRSRQAVFCVPGQAVFVRQLKIPATTPERLSRIIQFEAREQIPFPLDKTALEYQVFPSDNPNEVEVLLIAMRKDHIDGFMKLVRKTGLKPLAISVSSLALHNFYEINSAPRNLMDRVGRGPKSKPKGKIALGRKGKVVEEPEIVEEDLGVEFEEIQAEVNLGATIMDLAIPKAGPTRMVGFTRSVPRAGSQIDQAIRAKLNLSSLEEAKDIKEHQSAILSSEFELSGDADSVNMAASEAATAVIDTLTAEIRRSLDFFISQPEGVAVDSIVLSGGLSRMRYLDSYIEEKLGLPVERAAVKNEKIQVGEEATDLVPNFVIPMGLAFQGLGLAQVNIDFLPQDIKDVRAFTSNRIPVAIATVLLIVCILLGVRAGSVYTANNVAYVNQAQEYIERNRKENKVLSDAETLNAEVAGKYKELARVKGHPFFWLNFAELFLRTRPPDIVIEQLEMYNNGLVRVRGMTTKKSSIPDLQANLQAESTMIKSIHINDIPDPIVDSRFSTKVQTFTMDITTLSRHGRFRPIKERPDNTVPGSQQASSTTAQRPAAPGGRPAAPPPPPGGGPGRFNTGL